MKTTKNYIFTLFILFFWNGYCQQTKLKVGDKIPNFELYNQYARTFNPQNYIEKKSLVIFFYPEDKDKLSLKQFMIVKNNIANFEKFKTIVVGINPESIVSHKRVVVNNKLPIQLLFDRNNEIQEIFGVPYLKSRKPKRYTFVVDKNGIIAAVFHNKKDVKYHINQALIVLNNIKNN